MRMLTIREMVRTEEMILLVMCASKLRSLNYTIASELPATDIIAL